ncbi:bifunctional cobalt-precorrin-7 (C(5))-methyltransferase/cobalt-precorrin-6B (C(15))-methyltransferase [Scytonema millei]|uniref:tRNA (guanine(46)-N(7))-methyltransferase n=1 Tax=Scytonema millei VB511283 TaxID=1245923 RepID=A0A9X5E9G9_9CYAN|nr:bifunctional cobalt-precorrin-7 (C(5))-methyltransferase/cobalt-precorrin-6B (C(15))-methyltransferase [Scytonema millei]NHC37795.1 bifunctional cobalt-precorrin-7 (C(5))-methyltransferase/cobalt-precorrin-6B (C(15))-methyltransferase [Scytonema millei VB511283]
MTPIHVIGIGLDGTEGLVDSVRQLVVEAKLLVGSDRHLNYFPHHPAPRLMLGDFTDAIAQLRRCLADGKDGIVILVSGDPLFFGLGRLLLAELPPEQLTFHPHLSSIQLAFNRLKVPWQDARAISAHGRSLDELIQALQQGVEKIAVLTDKTNNPHAIARLLVSLDLRDRYQLWVCENLGGEDEVCREINCNVSTDNLSFAPLNIVVLLRQSEPELQLNLANLPQLGIPDRLFLSFSDRPGLMTKREVRLLILGELALQPEQIVWDIGAGTGSVSIEIARLFPTSKIYAIEKTAAGSALIAQNCQRFGVKNVTSIHGTAPEILQNLPRCDRVFIGGSSGNLSSILDTCSCLSPSGVLVIALATLEHLSTALDWFKHQNNWEYQLLQVQLSRSVPIAQLTRFAPLNPVTIITAKHL